MKKIVVFLLLLSVWACNTANQKERYNDRQLKRLIKKGIKIEPMDGRYDIEFGSDRRYHLFLIQRFNEELGGQELTGYFKDALYSRDTIVYPITEGHFYFDYIQDEYKMKFMADVNGYNMFVGRVLFEERKKTKYPFKILGICWGIEDSLKRLLYYQYSSSEFLIKVYDTVDSSYSYKKIEYKTKGEWTAKNRFN